MFTVTPIGSCRITTPLRRGQSVHGFNLNMDRCYGYCHSPAEAVQMAQFMQGDVNIPHDVWPLVSRKHELDEISSNFHEASDLYVIELASAKQVTIDGVSIQLNYLNATFPEFFADTERARTFWALAENGGPSELTDFLAHVWSATPQQVTEAQTLSRLQLRFVTRESLRRDIHLLNEMLTDVMFVSHVDAVKQDGQPIRSRSSFIQLVSEEVERAGCKFYNPTDLMKDVGQAAAIEDESTGLAHFTDSFSASIMGDWMRKTVAPKTDSAVVNGAEYALDKHLRPQIYAACDQGYFADVQARLTTLKSQNIDVQSLLDMASTAQHSAQSKFIEQTSNGIDMDKVEGNFVTANDLGLFDEAVELTEKNGKSLTDIPAHKLMDAGDLAAKLGAVTAAHKCYLAATNHGQSRAFNALVELCNSENIDVLESFSQDQRRPFLESITPSNRLKVLQRNGAQFSEALLDETDAEDTQLIISELADTHGIGYAAEVLAIWRERQDTDRITDAGLVSILEGWLETALGFEARVDRIHGLNAVLFAAPRFQPARVAMQSLRKELALLIRAAGKDGDIDTLDALAEDAAALASELPELDLWRARLRFNLGEFATAITLGKSAAELLPEKINVWVLLMRAAKKTESHAEAAEFANKVIGLTSSDTEALRSEAEAVLQSNLIGA